MLHASTDQGGRTSIARDQAWGPRAGWALILLALALGGLEAWHFGAHTLAALRFPYELDYGEGPLLHQIQRLARGESLYRPLGGRPYAITNYPLVYHYAVLALQRTGLELLVAARAVSVIAAVVTALAIGLLVPTCARRGAAAGGLLAGLSFLAVDSVWTWSGVARVDMLALALAAAGLVAFVRAPDDAWRLGLAVPLLVLAFFTKQSTVAAAAACFLAALWHRPRLALGLLSAALPALAAVLAWATWSTDGGFWFHVVTANRNAYEISRTIEFFGSLARGSELLLALGVGAAFVHLVVRARRGRSVAGAEVLARDVLALWVVTSLLVGLTVGKVGSNINYLVELMAAVCAMAGLAAADALSRLETRRGLGVALAVLASIAAHLARQTHLDFERDGIRRERSQGLAEVLAAIQAAPGEVLSEDMTLLALADKPLVFQPFIMTQLARQGRWDPTPIHDLIEQQHFDLVVLKQDHDGRVDEERFSAAVLEAIEAAYALRQQAGRYRVYAPL